MQRATLVVNTVAGRRKDLRTLVQSLVQVLEQAGVQTNAVSTFAAGEAQSIAVQAVAGGSDTIFACGGDGTVNEVLQGLVRTKTALGIVPLGTANVLARNLRLSLDPIKAIQQQLSFQPRAISVGEARYVVKEEAKRCFLVMAGAGPDGALVYRLLAGKSSKLGRGAYYTHSLRLFLTQRFPTFRVEYRRVGSSEWTERLAAGVMCSRVADLGGIYSRLISGTLSPERELLLTIVKPPAKLALPAWFALSRAGLNNRNPWLEAVPVSEFRCTPVHPDHRIHAELDGEWIGHLPMSVRLLPQAVSLLMPVSKT